MDAPRPGRRLPSHLRSNAIASLALFIALGGTAYAVALQPAAVAVC
jgi:hypothetical protein